MALIFAAFVASNWSYCQVCCLRTVNIIMNRIMLQTRMHSNRMRTARALTDHISYCQGGMRGMHAPLTCTPCHACPLPRMPPAMHAPPATHAPHHACPLPCMPPSHTCPCHAHPPAMHAPHHACPPATHAPPAMHTPL